MVKPELVLLALQREGFIGAEPHNIIDGIPVYAVVRPLQLHGLAVRFVEGWDHQGKLFARGPGTPPPVYIGITVEGDRRTVERRFLGADDSEPDERNAEPDAQDTDLKILFEDHIAAFNYAKAVGLISVWCAFSF